MTIHKKKNKAREHRIDMEAVVDAYGSEERAMGWYYYLEGKIEFPFKAKCLREKSILPLKKKEIVKVQSMATEEDCQHDMLVMVQWSGRKLAVPLSQLKGISVSDETKEAIEDWHYWIAMGYEF